MTSSPLVAGIELGGTKVVCTLATGPHDVRAEARIETRSPDETLDAVDRQLREWGETHGFSAIGFASFGPLQLDPDSDRYGFIVGTPKPGWDEVDLLARGRAFDVPLGFDTDVNGAALAEGRWGAARGLRSFAYVTVGTGIGAGSIIDGRAVRGLGHAEGGHMRVPRLPGRTFAGVCPFHGDCAEGLASGPAIRAQVGAGAETLAADHPAWEEVAHTLGGLFHNLVLTTAPQRILLGGGVGCGQAHLLPKVRSALIASLGGYAVAPRIARDIEAFLVHPALGDRAGPLGSIALALDALEG